MRRKAVSQRMRSVAEVRASLDTHGERIAGLLDGRHPPPPADESAFSYLSQFGRLDQELAAVQERLVAAEDAHVRKLVRLAKLRRRRDALVAGLYEKLISTRRILEGLYGPDRDFELAAVSGRTPQEPQVLAEQVDQTIKLLRRPEGEVPERTVGGVEIDFEALALDLEANLAELAGVRSELERTLKAADATRVATNGAIAEFDAVFPWVSRTLESLFRLAGERELADRIRTSVRVVTRRQGEDGGESPSEESPSEESGSEHSGSEQSASEQSASGESPSEESEAESRTAAEPASELSAAEAAPAEA